MVDDEFDFPALGAGEFALALILGAIPAPSAPGLVYPLDQGLQISPRLTPGEHPVMSEPKVTTVRDENLPDTTDALLAKLDALYPATDLTPLVLSGTVAERLSYAGKLEMIAELKQLRAEDLEARRESAASVKRK